MHMSDRVNKPPPAEGVRNRAPVPRISVIIEGWNESNEGGREECFALGETLQSLERQEFPPEHAEVLLMGTVRQVEVWRKQFPHPTPFGDLRFVAVDEDNGYAFKNEGARRAKSDLLAFCENGFLVHGPRSEHLRRDALTSQQVQPIGFVAALAGAGQRADLREVCQALHRVVRADPLGGTLVPAGSRR